MQRHHQYFQALTTKSVSTKHKIGRLITPAPYPGAITRYSSAIQGPPNAELYTNPQALKELSTISTPEKYNELILKKLEKFLESPKQVAESLYGEVTTVCSFDPCPHFENFKENKENSYWQGSINTPLLKIIAEDPTDTLEALK